MDFVGLDRIKLEQRIAWFDTKFKDILEVQKKHLDTVGKLDEIFVLDVLVHMLQYTCKELKKHNEDVSSIDTARITVYHTIEILQERVGCDIQKMTFDFMQILRYVTLLIAYSRTGEYDIEYLQDRVLQEKGFEISPLKRRDTKRPSKDDPKRESFETVRHAPLSVEVKRMVDDYTQSADEIFDGPPKEELPEPPPPAFAREMYTPTRIECVTPKTKRRLGNILGRKPRAI